MERCSFVTVGVNLGMVNQYSVELMSNRAEFASNPLIIKSNSVTNSQESNLKVMIPTISYSNK